MNTTANLKRYTDADILHSGINRTMTDRSSQLPAKNPRHHSESETADEPCSAEEIEAVRSCMAAFATATKSYSLYPKEHAISKNLLSGFENSLVNFFQTSPALKLVIEKDRISFKGIEIYRPKEKEDYLVTPLFRDGIIWIEFTKGVLTTEISFLLHILNEYRTLKDESEGDLVTALWKKNLPHVHYEASEVYWETEPKLDFSHFNVSGSSKEEIQGSSSAGSASAARNHPEGSEAEGQQATVSIAAAEANQDLMQITSNEKEILQKMIIEDERRNRTEDVLDVLLILLEDQDETDEFNGILEILTHEFETILRHGEFQLAIKTLGHLKELSDSYATPKSWQVPLLDQFFETASEPEVLEGLNEYVPKLKSEDASRIKTLRQVLVMMRPKAVLTIGPLLSEVSSVDVRRRLMEAIAILSKQDLGPLTQLLKMPDENLIQQFVIILGHLDDEESHKLLLNMARHSSLRVRRESLKQLLKRNGKVQQSFFFLLEDPSDIIRRDILNRLAAERNRSSEAFLLKYLDEKAYNISERDHIIGCYQALGRCGSSHSLSFLKAKIEGRPWADIFSLGQSLHRRGAAIALAGLGTPAAQEILQRAARSLFPQIKRAARGVTLEKRST